MKRSLLWLAAAVVLAGCQGSVPPLRGDPRHGYGGVLVRGRAFTPTGETYHARLALNFESDEFRYTLPFIPGQSTLYIVEPGKYRLGPLRGAFGVTENSLDVAIEGHLYRVPFPREVLRLDALDVRQGHIVAVGTMEARVSREPGARRPTVSVALDTSKNTRRSLVEEKIQHMLDPRISSDERETSIDWSIALDQALVDVQSDPDLRPAFKTRR